MRFAILTLAAIATCALSGCPARPGTDQLAPRVELIPLVELLAHPEYGKDAQRELDELVAGFPPEDVRRTETVAVSPAGYLCVLRVTTQRPKLRLLVQSLRVRHNVADTGRDISDKVHRLFIYWPDARGVSRSPVPLSWKADLAVRRQANVVKVTEEQNIAVQDCDYPYAAPPDGRKLILRTSSEQTIAARHQLIKKEGPAATLLLQFATDLRTNETSFSLVGAGINVTIANRAAPPPPPTPTTEPAAEPTDEPIDDVDP